MDKELPLKHTQKKIEQNLNMLKSKLEVITIPFEDFLCLKLTSFCAQHSITEANINLYSSLKQSLADIDFSDLI